MLQARFFFKPEKCDDVSGGAINATVGFPVNLLLIITRSKIVGSVTHK